MKTLWGKVNRRQFTDPADADLNAFLDRVKVIFIETIWDGTNQYVNVYYSKDEGR